MVAIHGHFDGKVIIPDEPVDLPRNTRLLIHVQNELPEGTPGATLLKIAGSIDPQDLKRMSDAIEQDCERIDNE